MSSKALEAKISLIITDESKLNTLPVKDGQMLFIRDKQKIVFDFNGNRIEYKDIIVLNKDSDRTKLPQPNDQSLYFIKETYKIWYYDSNWHKIGTDVNEIISYTKPDTGIENVLYIDKAKKIIQVWDKNKSSYIDIFTQTDIETLKKNVSDLNSQKVDKVDGKQLSTNDFTDEYKKMLEDLSYVKISFSSVSIDKASNEIGSTVTSVNANWKLNKTPKTLKIQFGADPQETLENNVTTKSYTGKSIKTNTNIVLTATDERDFATTKQLTISFQPKAYWGVVNNKSSYTSEDILALSNSVLTSSRQRTLNVNVTSGKHAIYAIPSSFGTPVFNVGGFDGGFIKVGTINHTNASGHAQNYDVWKSVNAGLGNISVLVK